MGRLPIPIPPARYWCVLALLYLQSALFGAQGQAGATEDGPFFPEWPEVQEPFYPLYPAGVHNPVLTREDVTDASAVSVADPFLFHEDGLWYMFFEVLAGYGVISVAESSDGLHWTYDRIVLDVHRHISYPYVFKYGDEYYMTPESSSAQTVDLYRAADFPYSWQYVCTLVGDRVLKDPVVILRDQIWYLFAATSDSCQLLLYESNDLLEGWVEHPMSPVVRDCAKARPAGRFINFDGDRLIRLAQKCDVQYGQGVRAFQIDTLTTSRYAEHELAQSPILFASGAGWNSDAMHHCDPWWTGEHWLAAVDGLSGHSWSIGIYGDTLVPPVPEPPCIAQEPRSRRVSPGESVTFSVSATGTEPLSYQWQKNGGEIPGAESSDYTIAAVAWSDAGRYRCIVTNEFGSATSNEAVLTVLMTAPNGHPVVDTGQFECYSDAARIACPDPGEPFYGQDSQCLGNGPLLSVKAGTMLVQDNVTGLVWQRSPDTNGDGSLTASDKLTWTGARARPVDLGAENFGGRRDWRLPTIKELYSLIDFRGTDPSGMPGDDTSGLTPFIDTDFFQFAYGETSTGERITDSQYASSDLYVGLPQEGEGQRLFCVNFADGQIEALGLGVTGSEKTFFVQCVSGNPSYSLNDFVDNGDGTVSDLATRLMWSQADNGEGLTWEEALAWVQAENAAGYLGHDDWRLPNAKELESIVDYTRAPDAADPSRRGPAIDPVFTCTEITNEACEPDYPWYWAGTTHVDYTGSGVSGVYVCFGRALGYIEDSWADVHGAGAQRSDPKSGGLSGYAQAGCGYYDNTEPQGDAIRIENYVRLVRGGGAMTGVDLGGGADRTPAIWAVPNPVSGATAIVFALAGPAEVRLKVYDVAGRLVVSLLDGRLAAGGHRIVWYGRDEAGRAVRSGLYVAKLETPGETRSAKVLVIR